MTGFALDWLALREPADAAARAPQLLAMARHYLEGVPEGSVVDLGSGTGSTMRAFGETSAGWTLVDHDPALLAAARSMLGARDDATFLEADLRDLDALPLEGASLVTASALFDLVSADWLAEFAGRLVRERTALYAALSYDGTMVWEEQHELDAVVVEAFNAHQAGDKGFGAALGPKAGEQLVSHFVAGGFAVGVDDSTWRLEPGDLYTAFVEGVVDAVSQTGRCDLDVLAQWRAFRLDRARSGLCTVGHVDVLAVPKDDEGRGALRASELTR
ncbi:class I SAM-dependent methyltransferase [Aureimonas mangrovi]|uniref:class I SAM-dependent methyltransferase n=1 Tax=Aureimonas mangrovi TaxID=2758041 RepID=UPI00163D44CB|nr:class I SAM-dependent methyltransferase [Aureimonas mangrovi]